MSAALRKVVDIDTAAANSAGTGSSEVGSVGTETGIGTMRATSVHARVRADEAVESRVPIDLDLEQLYPASAEVNTKLSQSLILLSQCLQRLDKAIDYRRSKEALMADDQINHLLVLLDELFCLRDLSEGFASVVNAASNSIRNLHGQPIELSHLYALNSCLLAIRKKPLIPFDASLEMLERLEDSGLNPDVVGTDVAVDWLSDEGAG